MPDATNLLSASADIPENETPKPAKPKREKKTKAPAAPVESKPRGKLLIIKAAILHRGNDITDEEIQQILKDRGFDPVAESTLQVARSDLLHTLRVLIGEFGGVVPRSFFPKD